MRMLATLAVAFLATAAVARSPLDSSPTTQPASPLAKPDGVFRIALGSCYRHTQPAPIFKTIAAIEPDVLLLLGDNVYPKPNDLQSMGEAYKALTTNPDFVAIRDSLPVHATWDDHDFGRNDAGAEFELKKDAQKLFLKHLGSPWDPRRNREGVYANYFHYVGGRDVEQAFSVRILLLDTRYFRGPLNIKRIDGRRHYVPHDEPVDLLGDAQWKWLKDELAKPADLTIIGSSIQFVAEEHRFEKWANFPSERERMLKLIAKTKADNVIFVSGDRHRGELSKITGEPDGKVGETRVPYPIYDLTASAFNQGSDPRSAVEPNRWRIAGERMVRVANAGVIDIVPDEAGEEATVTFRLIGDRGETLLEHSIDTRELAMPKLQEGTPPKPAD